MSIGSETRFESDDETVKAVVEFPESYFRRLDQARKKLKIGWSELFKRAVCAKIKSSGIRAVKGGAQ